MRLLLPPALRAETAAAAEAARPAEACGLLEGTAEPGGFAGVAMHFCANRAVRIDRFAIDPAVHIGLNRRLRGGPTAVIGCFHSHPRGRAEPSTHDVAAGGAASFVWLIAGFEGGAWSLAGFLAPDFRPLELVPPA